MTQIAVFVLVITTALILNEWGYLNYLTGPIFCIVIGIPISMFVDYYYDNKKMQLMQQLEQMAFKSKCPKCGQVVPKGNFAFCPFCGTSLKPNSEK